MTKEEQYMARCLYLASLGKYDTAPNPMVGAILVYNERIIGEGYHRKFGDLHAEPNCFNSVNSADKHLITKSTLYVNLEPCSHYGKTPPCANLIVNSGVKKVVIGSLDPNPLVAGNGVAVLQSAGIEVVVGILENKCDFLNRRFITFHTQKRPYITLKWAMSSNEFVDLVRSEFSSNAVKFSNDITQQFVHKMRAENMAIMVGTNCALLDNPSLTVKKWCGKSPIRVVVDRDNTIPNSYSLKNEDISTIIFNEKISLEKNNLRYIKLDNVRDIQNIVSQLYSHNINSLLVEGGTQLLNSFIITGLFDEINVEISPICLKNGVKAPKIPNEILDLLIKKELKIDDNLWIRYRKNS